MSVLFPTVDPVTKLFPEPTMRAIRATIPAASPEAIGAAVNAYLSENPVSADEPLLAAHIADETPHAVYDDIPSLTLLFENGII